MSKFIDKLIIFFFCMIICLQNYSNLYTISIVIVSVITSSFIEIFNKDILKKLTFIIYLVLSVIFTNFTYFIPFVCYEAFDNKNKWYNIIAVIPVILLKDKVDIISQIIIISFIFISYLMKYRNLSIQTFRKEYTNLRDSSKEFSIALKNKNKELLEKQDYEVHIATLKERNRIAGEIHDGVGHLLSSSILQIGALMAKNKDEQITGNLLILKETLSKAMDSIRSSVHNMHDEYIDLESEVKKIVRNFKFCDISLDYNIHNNPQKNIKFTFVCVIKEALSNIIKHSNATIVDINLKEHPAFYQLIISDNGDKKDNEDVEGIGLKNMTDRILSLNGIININKERGFSIFISIPKEK